MGETKRGGEDCRRQNDGGERDDGDMKEKGQHLAKAHRHIDEHTLNKVAICTAYT